MNIRLKVDMTKLVNSLKAALAKKHAAQHPDAKVDDTKTKVVRPPVVANRPVKKVTGRGG